MQVYSSALIFSPRTSIIRRLYLDTAKFAWIRKLPEVEEQWDPELFALDARSSRQPINHDASTTLAFSPSGATLATMTGSTIPIWDSTIGSQSATHVVPDYYHVLFDGEESGRRRFYSGWERTFGWRRILEAIVVFSPCETTLAIGMVDRMHFLDLNTHCVSRLESTHRRPVAHLLFSPRGKAFVSCDNHTLLFWNTETRTIMSTILLETIIPILGSAAGSTPPSLSFSPDGQTSAIGYMDQFCCLLKLWNVDLDEVSLQRPSFPRAAIYKSGPFSVESHWGRGTTSLLTFCSDGRLVALLLCVWKHSMHYQAVIL